MDLQRGDVIGLTACSDGRTEAERAEILRLMAVLQEMGLRPVLSEEIYARTGAYRETARKRAGALMRFYADDSVRAIFDISGGDTANGILEYLDFDWIRRHPKPFWGYSDLTAVLNALFCRSGAVSCLYQIRNLVRDRTGRQLEAFRESLFSGWERLFRVQWRFVQGCGMEGVVIGGNARCFLKLAGTPYLPDFQGKLLLLEGYGGGAPQLAAYLRQLRQMGAFSKLSGLLLGSFTRMEERGERADAIGLAQEIVGDPRFTIAETREIGHQASSGCIRIGALYRLK